MLTEACILTLAPSTFTMRCIQVWCLNPLAGSVSSTHYGYASCFCTSMLLLLVNLMHSGEHTAKVVYIMLDIGGCVLVGYCIV